MKGMETCDTRIPSVITRRASARTGQMRKAVVVGGLAALLSGCELLPEHAMLGTEPEEPAEATACTAQPTFADEACLLHNWVAFGLASQRGDNAWRNEAVTEIESAAGRSEAERELARAVALAWGSEREWREAATIYQEYTAAAPEELQPLLRYWRNELEGRRSLAGHRDNARGQLANLQRENAELSEKLEALTAIEQNMNLRQQSP